MFKSIAFDDHVMAALDHGTRDIDKWQHQLPEDVRSQVVAIVEAPSWTEFPLDAKSNMSSLPSNAEILTVHSLILGAVAVAAILCGIFFGFIFQSAVIVYLCLTVAAVCLGTTIFLQSRAKGFSAAFGIAPAIPGTQTRADFVKFQKGLAETLRISGWIVSILVATLSVPGLYAIDERHFGGVDSVTAASIRAGIIFLIPTAIWIAWYGCSQKRGAVLKVARCLRGFLARRLSPLWVSWLYEAKRKPAKVDAVKRTDRTMEQVAVDYWPLLALFLICIVFFANTGWLEGKYNVETVPGYPRGKMKWVNYVVQWLFEYPTSTLFVAAPLGSFSIAFFTYQLSRLVIPKFAGIIAIAIFCVSMLVFAARGAA